MYLIPIVKIPWFQHTIAMPKTITTIKTRKKTIEQQRIKTITSTINTDEPDGI